MSKYKIIKIEPKDGKLKGVHERWIDAECEIERLEIGHSMILTNTAANIGLFSNMLFTSRVSDATIDENGDVTVFTKNTAYYLQFVE